MSALALERQAIEKTFPTSRRGYDTGAVDAHLVALATEAERLQQELDRAARAAVDAVSPTRGPSLSATASEQLQVIVEAAEHSASEIERAAAEESARVRSDADAEARRVREEAVARAQDHIARVAAVTTAMLERVGAMEDELGALFESVRTGTTRLTTELTLLHEHLGELHGPPSATAAAPGAPGPPAAPAAVEAARVVEAVALGGAEPDDEAAAAPAQEDEAVVEEDEEEEAEAEASVPLEPDAATAVEPAPAAAPVGPRLARRKREADVEGARLTALSMALDGKTREEADAFLDVHFDLPDRAGLLDEVYASVAG